jgi:hypothetical protein
LDDDLLVIVYFVIVGILGFETPQFCEVVHFVEDELAGGHVGVEEDIEESQEEEQLHDQGRDKAVLDPSTDGIAGSCQEDGGDCGGYDDGEDEDAHEHHVAIAAIGCKSFTEFGAIPFDVVREEDIEAMLAGEAVEAGDIEFLPRAQLMGESALDVEQHAFFVVVGVAEAGMEG